MTAPDRRFDRPATLAIRTDRRLVRAAGRSERFLLVELVAPVPMPDPSRARTPLDIGFVLDRSGSMAGRGKLDIARAGVLEAIDRLAPTDRFAVVVYDERVEVIVESTPASAEARRHAADALRTIGPRGSTDLAGGWLRGAEQVAANLDAKALHRVLLLTDGLANVGITDPAELARHAAELRHRGIVTSTIGVGEDFDEALLQGMADAGGGRYLFAGSMPEIRDHLTGEVGEALEVVARDAVLEVITPEDVTVDALTPHPCETRGARTSVRLGDLIAGQLARAVLRVRFPAGEAGGEVGALVAIGDADGVLAAAGAAPIGIEWRFASHEDNDAQPRDRLVDRAVAELFAARARQEAVARNRDGDWQGAAAALRAVAGRIADYAGSDETLLRLVAELREVDAPRMAAPMPELARKSMHYAAGNVSRMRDAQGRSRRA